MRMATSQRSIWPTTATGAGSWQSRSVRRASDSLAGDFWYGRLTAKSFVGGLTLTAFCIDEVASAHRDLAAPPLGGAARLGAVPRMRTDAPQGRYCQVPLRLAI
jgi:hypothetical protein